MATLRAHVPAIFVRTAEINRAVDVVSDVVEEVNAVPVDWSPYKMFPKAIIKEDVYNLTEAADTVIRRLADDQRLEHQEVYIVSFVDTTKIADSDAQVDAIATMVQACEQHDGEGEGFVTGFDLLFGGGDFRFGDDAP